jgi:hypothetical protein
VISRAISSFECRWETSIAFPGCNSFGLDDELQNDQLSRKIYFTRDSSQLNFMSY